MSYQRASDWSTDKTPRHSMLHAKAAAAARYIREMPAAMARLSPNVRRPVRNADTCTTGMPHLIACNPPHRALGAWFSLALSLPTAFALLHTSGPHCQMPRVQLRASRRLR